MKHKYNILLVYTFNTNYVCYESEIYNGNIEQTNSAIYRSFDYFDTLMAMV